MEVWVTAINEYREITVRIMSLRLQPVEKMAGLKFPTGQSIEYTSSSTGFVS